uniref:TcaA NTF2-like domain-containing protein n=1 Tax=Staphylococcus epidermidis TaxID=1282 RepID=UPI001E2FE21A
EDSFLLKLYYKFNFATEPLKILSVEQNDNKFTVTASKKLDKTTIKSKYVLKYDKDLDEFKIIDYTDI